MAIVNIYSMVMHLFVNDKLILASTYCLSYFQKQRTHDGKSIAEVVKEVLARVSNIEPSKLTGETDLTEIGLSSMTLSVAISDINLALKTMKNSRLLSSSSLSMKGVTSTKDLIALATARESRTSVHTISASISASISKKEMSSSLGNQIRQFTVCYL